MADDADRARVDANRIAQLERQLDRALSEAAHWKGNHDNQVARARILTERPDVPLERVAAYHELAILRARLLAFADKPVATTIEREVTAAAIEAAIQLGYGGNVMKRDEDAWLVPFALIGADMAIHDKLRACVIAITAELRSGDYTPGRGVVFAPDDPDALQLETFVAIALNRPMPKQTH